MKTVDNLQYYTSVVTMSSLQTCKASATGLLQQNLGIIGGVGAAIAVIQVIKSRNCIHGPP